MRADLLRHTTRWALEQALRAGRVQRASRGRYVLPSLPPALKLAETLSGWVSHESAAQYWSLESVCEPSAVHITVPANAHRARHRQVALHYATLDHADTVDARVTGPVRTVLDCARTMPFREALAVADSGLRRGLVDREELVRAAELLAGPGCRRARNVSALASGLAANAFESALRGTIIESGVGGFEPQLVITDCAETYRVDIGDPGRRIVAEADSFTFHGTRAALDRDCRRYDELVRHDWTVLRFSWEQVMFDPRWITSVIIDCCALRDTGLRGGSIAAGDRGRVWRAA